MNEKYRISVMKLKEEFLELLETEKEKRKRERKLNKGFKPKEFDEEGYVIIIILLFKGKKLKMQRF